MREERGKITRILIETGEKHIAYAKQYLEELKQAQKLAGDKEVIPMACYRYDMQNLMVSAIAWLQLLVEKAGDGSVRRKKEGNNG